MSGSAQLLLTFLPLYGAAFTIIVASITWGRVRWAVLIVVPAVTWIIGWMLNDDLARDMNFIWAVLFGIYTLGMLMWYPVLGVVWMELRRREGAFKAR